MNYIEHVLKKALVSDDFSKKFGKTARVFYVKDGDNFVGFFTVVEQDYLPVPEYNRYIAFVDVHPDYRGQHLSNIFIAKAEDVLSQEDTAEVHIVRQHKGLYEKMAIPWNDSSRKAVMTWIISM